MSAESAIGNGALIWTVPDAPLSLRNVPYLTDYDTIGLIWNEAPENGGTPVIDYRVAYSYNSEPYVELESNIILLPYQANQLTVGTTYSFKVQARNAHGYGAYSSEVMILAAQNPQKPAAPTTTFDTTQVIVDWSAPFDEGSTITKYEIYIRTNDAVTYSLELTYCDGSVAQIVSDTRCEIPVSTLRVAPFNLYWGDSVYAKVIAFNMYGQSLESDTGNGAIIITYPDAPLFLEEDLNYRDWTTLGLKWNEAYENGGSQISSYVLSLAIEQADFQEI